MGKCFAYGKLLCAAIGFIICAQSCINDSNVVENVTERAHKKITVLGYGSEKGANSKGTEMLARQFAMASLGEQLNGSRFTFIVSGNMLSFASESKADIPGMREYFKKIEQVGGQYLVFYVMGTEIDIEYPRQFGIYDKSYGESGENITAVISGMKMKAVSEAASDRFTSRMPRKLSGRIFITSLKATKADGSDVFRVDATFSVLFDSITR
jgi:hypothetical protein